MSPSQQESWQLLVSSIETAIGAAPGSAAGAGGPQQWRPIVESKTFLFRLKFVSWG
jgi:hypothetical protein